MKFIINADDFGRTETVNRAIVECFENGYLSCTTIMVNTPFYHEAKTLAMQNGFLDKVGLHINLITGIPLTSLILNCHRLVNQEGRFSGEIFKRKTMMFFLTSKEKKAIRLEIRAQIERFLADGFLLLHADSHGHIHTFPSIQGIFLRELYKFGFKSVRISRNIGKMKCSFLRLYKLQINQGFKRRFCCTTYFGALSDVLNDQNYIIKQSGFTEIMLHPNYLNGKFDTGEPFQLTQIPRYITENMISFSDLRGDIGKSVI